MERLRHVGADGPALPVPCCAVMSIRLTSHSAPLMPGSSPRLISRLRTGEPLMISCGSRRIAGCRSPAQTGWAQGQHQRGDQRMLDGSKKPRMRSTMLAASPQVTETSSPLVISTRISRRSRGKRQLFNGHRRGKSRSPEITCSGRPSLICNSGAS